MLPTEDYASDIKHSWCPGCGNAVILQSMRLALKELKIPNENLVFVSGIGCGSKFPHYVSTYGMETLHGRVLPNATGIKLANNKLTVIGICGDGDAYGIGLNHFIHTMRRNLDLTYVIQNNEIYALTKGQTSPVSPKGFKSPTTPSGTIEEPINPIALALTSNATFIARTFSMDPKHMKKIFMEGIKHKGISMIDVLQTCPSMNPGFNFAMLKEKVYKLEDEGHDKTDWNAAMVKAKEMNGKIPLGIFYQETKKVERPTYSDELPQMRKKSLVDHDISNVDIAGILEKYK